MKDSASALALLGKAMPSAERAGEGEVIGRDAVDGCEPKFSKLKGEREKGKGCVVNSEKGK